MSVRSVARKDFLDARRARLVRLVGLHYALLVVLFFVHVRLTGGGNVPDALAALWNMAFVGAVFVPAIALVAAYLAIAGERESGSIKHLLGTPVSRRAIVAGKYVSRAGIVAASLLVGFAAAGLLSAAWFGSVRPDVFLAVAGLTTLYALAYVAVAVGISAAADSRSRAMLGALGFYLTTNLITLNDEVSGLAALEYALGRLGLDARRSVIEFFGMVTNPTRAYLFAAVGTFPDPVAAAMDAPIDGDLAWFLGADVAALVLLAWLVVPILLGLAAFERADIG